MRDSGRELDAKIAERLMGFTDVIPIPTGVYEGSEHGGVWTEIPRYSTDIAEAWKVVEKVKDLWPDIEWIHKENIWRVTMMVSGPDFIEEEAGTAPLAICLAALKATEDSQSP